MRCASVVAAAIGIALGLSGCGSCGKSRGLSFDPPALPEGKVGEPYHAEVKALDTHTPVGQQGHVPYRIVIR